MSAGLGSITLKSNQLYYYYFSILQLYYYYIIFKIQQLQLLLHLKKVIVYITNYFSTDGTKLTEFMILQFQCMRHEYQV